MSADFVPFLQSLNPRVSSADQPSSFAPLPQTAAGPASYAPPVPPTAKGEVKVELKRDGDRITQIRIQCRCGELIELNCDYA